MAFFLFSVRLRTLTEFAKGANTHGTQLKFVALSVLPIPLTRRTRRKYSSQPPLRISPITEPRPLSVQL